MTIIMGGHDPALGRGRDTRGDKGGNKSLAHISGSSDQLLPTFYENVSSIQNRQKMLGKARIPGNKLI